MNREKMRRTGRELLFETIIPCFNFIYLNYYKYLKVEGETYVKLEIERLERHNWDDPATYTVKLENLYSEGTIEGFKRYGLSRESSIDILLNTLSSFDNKGEFLISPEIKGEHGDTLYINILSKIQE